MSTMWMKRYTQHPGAEWSARGKKLEPFLSSEAQTFKNSPRFVRHFDKTEVTINKSRPTTGKRYVIG